MADEKQIKVPDVGDHDSLELMNWLVNEGSKFQKGDEICELVTDKAVFPIEAEADGQLTKIDVQAPSAVTVDQIIGQYVYFDQT